MKGNLYYPEDEAEVAILDAAYQALITDMEIAAALENELKSVRSRVDQSITQGKDVLRGIARYCEAWDSSDEALGSVGWTRCRTPGPAKPMPVPSGLVMQPGSNPGQVRARWNAVPNRYFYDIQVFNSAGQPNPVPWDSVPSTQDIRVIQLFSGYPSGSFLTVRIRANGSKGAGPWCDPLTARVP